MNKYNYSITAFNNDTYDDVAIKLGECQRYSNRRAKQMMSDAGIDSNSHLNFFQLMRFLSNVSDLVVTFYGIQNDSRLHIFSDFFNLEAAFSDSFSFFDDLNCVLMLCENRVDSINFSLIKSGQILFQFEEYVSEEEKLPQYSWKQDYEKLCSNIDILPAVSEIENSINFLRDHLCKSDKQMLKYLEKNAIFKDKYIV